LTREGIKKNVSEFLKSNKSSNDSKEFEAAVVKGFTDWDRKREAEDEAKSTNPYRKREELGEHVFKLLALLHKEGYYQEYKLMGMDCVLKIGTDVSKRNVGKLLGFLYPKPHLVTQRSK